MKFALFSSALLASSVASAAPAVDGWYLSGFGGLTHVASNINTNYYGGLFRSHVRYQDGYNAGGRIGYQSYPIRYEFEYTYLSANPDRFKVDFIGQTGVNGRVNGNLVMANLYYDFPNMLDVLSVFLGGGIGYAFMETSLNSTGPFIATYFKENANSFAYQGTVGLTYNFSENYALNAAYRYVATSSSNHFGKNLQAQMGSVGVIYRFDCNTYK